MPIIVARRSGTAERAEPSPFEDEAEMQRFLTDLPGLIPVDEIDEGARLLVLAREFGTTSGPVDAIGIDQFGSVYVIEAKLSRNADKRKVLAQALDYGAALWRAGANPEAVLAALDAAHGRASAAPGSVRATAMSAFDLSEPSAEVLLDAVRQNLRDGRFRFVVVMDQIDERLRDLFAYVNQASTFDLFGVELDLYRLTDLDVVIPKLYGAEARKPADPAARTKQVWTEANFFPELDRRHGPEVARAAHMIFDWGGQAGSIEWRGGDSYGGFFVVASSGDVSQRLFKVSVDGSVIVYANHYSGTDSGTFGESPGRWDALRERLGAAGFVLPETIGSGKTPYVMLAEVDAPWLISFSSAFDWVIANLATPGSRTP